MPVKPSELVSIKATLISPALGIHVSNVVILSSLKEMCRVTTWRIVAPMQSARFWPFAIRNEEGNAMRQENLAVHPDASVAIRVNSASPRPALIRTSNLDTRPQPICNRNAASTPPTLRRAKLIGLAALSAISSRKRIAAVSACKMMWHSSLLHRHVCEGCRTTNPTPLIIPCGGC